MKGQSLLQGNLDNLALADEETVQELLQTAGGEAQKTRLIFRNTISALIPELGNLTRGFDLCQKTAIYQIAASKRLNSRRVRVLHTHNPRLEMTSHSPSIADMQPTLQSSSNSSATAAISASSSIQKLFCSMDAKSSARTSFFPSTYTAP